MANHNLKYIYLIFADNKFNKIVEKQLFTVLPSCNIQPYRVYSNNKAVTVFFKVESQENLDSVLAKISNTSPFIDFILPVDIILNTKPIDYSKIEDAISKVIDTFKYRSFKIEVKKLGYSSSETAKSIEVHLGRDLEKKGYVADLNNPELAIYCILLNNSTIIGHLDTSKNNEIILDHFRQANKEKVEVINRAEYKLKEALQIFRIDLKQHKRALDIGAAPGGWTHYLSQHGIKVVAVDNAFLDYKKLGNGKNILIIADTKEVPQIKKSINIDSISSNIFVCGPKDKIRIDKFDIIHIKANIEKNNMIKLLKKFGKFDLLTIDANISPLESAYIANTLSSLLEYNATLIMSIKLVTKAFSKHISDVVNEISKNYCFIKLKKLPHNRQEITLCAIKKV